MTPHYRVAISQEACGEATASYLIFQCASRIYPYMSINQVDSPLENADKLRLQTLCAALGTVGDELSLPLLRALLIVAIKPGLSVNELADHLSVPQQSASRYVSVLLGRYENVITGPSQALISQEVNPHEPRKRALYLSAAGSKQAIELSHLMKSEGEQRGCS